MTTVIVPWCSRATVYACAGGTYSFVTFPSTARCGNGVPLGAARSSRTLGTRDIGPVFGEGSTEYASQAQLPTGTGQA
jgi:hypothetical protein